MSDLNSYARIRALESGTIPRYAGGVFAIEGHGISWRTVAPHFPLRITMLWVGGPDLLPVL